MCVLQQTNPTDQGLQAAESIEPQRIFIVDDHPLMRQGYKAIISSEPDLGVCGEAADAFEAIDKIAEAAPDLVITDLSMEGMNGLELSDYVHREWPELPIVISSTYEVAIYGRRAQQAGAIGYVQKSDLLENGIRAIRCFIAKETCPNCPYVFKD